MRDGWTKTTLGGVAVVVNGSTPSTKNPEFWGGEIPWITTTELTAFDDGYASSSSRKITPNAVKSGGARIVRSGVTLLGTTATIGTVALAEVDTSFNQQISGLVPKSEKVVDEFLFMWARGNRFQLEDIAAGTSFKRISTVNLKNLYFLLPPLEEQKRIVDVVSSVDAYIDALQQQADTARTARNAVLLELLSAGGDDWTETTLGDIAKCAGGSAFPHEYQGGDTGTPFVKVSDMNEAGNERFLNSSNNYVSKEAIKSLGARVWPKGTVVFAKVGAALLTEKRRILVQDTIFDNNIMGLVPKASIESHFLYLFMETVRLGDFVQPGAVPSVNNSIVSEIEINLPPVEEQKRIVEVVSSMDDVIQATEKAIADAKNLRSGLLSDLLSGVHEIPVSYDKFLGAA